LDRRGPFGPQSFLVSVDEATHLERVARLVHAVSPDDVGPRQTPIGIYRFPQSPSDWVDWMDKRMDNFSRKALSEVPPSTSSGLVRAEAATSTTTADRSSGVVGSEAMTAEEDRQYLAPDDFRRERFG